MSYNNVIDIAARTVPSACAANGQDAEVLSMSKAKKKEEKGLVPYDALVEQTQARVDDLKDAFERALAELKKAHEAELARLLTEKQQWQKRVEAAASANHLDMSTWARQMIMQAVERVERERREAGS